MNLTKAQLAVLKFIRRFAKKQGFPPTHRDIADGMGFRSPNAASDFIKVLVRKGALKHVQNRARGIRIA